MSDANKDFWEELIKSVLDLSDEEYRSTIEKIDKESTPFFIDSSDSDAEQQNNL